MQLEASQRNGHAWGLMIRVSPSDYSWWGRRFGMTADETTRVETRTSEAWGLEPVAGLRAEPWGCGSAAGRWNGPAFGELQHRKIGCDIYDTQLRRQRHRENLRGQPSYHYAWRTGVLPVDNGGGIVSVGIR